MRVDRLFSNLAIDVKFTQFPLHPNTPPEGLTLEQLFAGRSIDIPAAQARMRQLITAEGLPYGARTMTFNSRLAQELAKWAESQQANDIHRALFEAYFVEGVNISQVDNLVSIAERVGLNADRTRDVLTERRMKSNVDADWKRSQQMNVTGVPTFIVESPGGSHSVVGAQAYEVLEEILLTAGAQRRLASGDSVPKDK